MDAMVDKEIDNKLAKANSSFSRLYKIYWKNKHLKSKKIKCGLRIILNIHWFDFVANIEISFSTVNFLLVIVTNEL